MSSRDGFLNAAAAIGRRIVAEAIWHEGRCSWMGAAAEPADRGRPEYRALGPLVYDGTAGVALFLAHLAQATGEASPRRAAAGALRHAIERAAALPPERRGGLHGGTLGIACAAVRIAELLDDDEALDGARAARSAPAGAEVAAAPLTARSDPAVAVRSHDLVLGTAGEAVALLALGDAGGAVADGEALLAAAAVSRRGWSWADPVRPSPRHLCGVAHGAGGIGWALLELFAATGDERYAAAARGAFAYERSWLDAGSGTWPDLRNPAAPSSMTATWCYGEAGIALCRLRAQAVLADPAICQDTNIALQATRRHLAARLPYAIDDLSICHGAGGAALALLAAGETDAASALGHVALERHGEAGDWPCGVYGTTPGLYRGLSGIGWLFLCLHDPEIPSPLELPGSLTAPAAGNTVVRISAEVSPGERGACVNE